VLISISGAEFWPDFFDSFQIYSILATKYRYEVSKGSDILI
jgi:hypothetical protein